MNIGNAFETRLYQSMEGGQGQEDEEEEGRRFYININWML